MLIRFQDCERNEVYVNPDDVTTVEGCGGNRPLSFIRLRDGSKVQVLGTPNEICGEIERREAANRLHPAPERT